MKRLLLLSVAFTALINAPAATIVVDAGDFARRDVLVEFKLPANGEFSAEANGESIAIQRGEKGSAAMIVPSLKRNEKRTYRLVPFRGDAANQVTAKSGPGDVECSAFGKTVFTYNTDKTELPAGRPDLNPIFRRGGYIHPVLSPSGAQVTDDYPRNHKHHHGIWFGWTHTEFEGRQPDFWNMGDKKGTVEFVGLDKTWSGPVHAGFTSRHRQVDLTSPAPKTALNETWNVRLLAMGKDETKPCFVFDVEITDTCATQSPVKLPQYRYGGICVRGNWAWNGKTNAFVLTSEGETDRAKGDKGQVLARWVHLGGLVDGKLTGIAGLDHPANFRAPEPVRLNAAEPYFNFTQQQAGDMEITPAKPWVGRYRFVVADGAPDRAALDRLWNDYAHPPTVVISE
jgi:hypothetical protein